AAAGPGRPSLLRGDRPPWQHEPQVDRRRVLAPAAGGGGSRAARQRLGSVRRGGRMNGGSLLDRALIADLLTREAPWRGRHGAEETYVGAGLLYYTLTYTLRAEVAVCLGSGGGFVPRLMRQAQRDAGIAVRSRTILVDGDVPDAGWGSPQWLEPDSFFRVHYPDVELVLESTSAAAERVFGAEGV